MNFSLNTESANIKTGAIPVSMSDSATCPDACPFKSNGCYAAQGPMNWIWKALDRGTMNRKGKVYNFGIQWDGLLLAVSSLAQGIFWRHNQAGDLKGENNQIDSHALRQLVGANKGKRGFTYTHKPVLDRQGEFAKANREAIAHANSNGFTVNLSGNNLAHADELKALGIGPVVAIVPDTFEGTKGTTPAGNRFVVCPAQTKEGTTCKDCQLCQKQRSVIVAFKSHGMGKNKVNQIANK